VHDALTAYLRYLRSRGILEFEEAPGLFPRIRVIADATSVGTDSRG
jgi:hypothetical protein